MGFADALIGLTGIILATKNLNIEWSSHKFIIYVIFIIAGSIIDFSIFWTAISISFWKVRASGIFLILNNFNSLTQKYPANAFGRWYKVLVTGFIPFAFINYYPVIYILEKKNTGEYRFMSFISPVVAFIMLSVGFFVWIKGIKNYSSTGS